MQSTRSLLADCMLFVFSCQNALHIVLKWSNVPRDLNDTKFIISENDQEIYILSIIVMYMYILIINYNYDTMLISSVSGQSLTNVLLGCY